MTGPLPIHHRKIKVITLTIGTVVVESQVQSWTMNNNTDDGDKLYAQSSAGAAGEFRDEAEPDYSLDLTLYSDWRSAGITRYLTEHDQETAAFVLDHHPDVALEHVTWAGDLKLRAPNAGGDARTNEMTQVTLVVIGKPAFTAADES